MGKYLIILFLLSCGSKADYVEPTPEVIQGANCYDGLEDLNGDEIIDVEDCRFTKVIIAEGPQGPKGDPGKDGEDGQDGKDGTNCTITAVSNGALVTCGDEAIVVKNGADGKDATVTPSSSTGFIDPCGDNPSEQDEIILVTASGDYISYYQTKSHRFLTILGPGVYKTADSQKCDFEITVSGDYVEL